MSARPGILAGVTHPADGGRSPNRYVPVITAEVRVFWPPLATDEQIEGALSAATASAREMIADKRVSRDR